MQIFIANERCLTFTMRSITDRQDKYNIKGEESYVIEKASVLLIYNVARANSEILFGGGGILELLFERLLAKLL